MARTGRAARLSHIGPKGDVRMVDVSGKSISVREACASAVIRMKRPVLDAIMGGDLEKGDALNTARVAAVLAAKRTSEWIPLCHPLPLDGVRVEFERSSPTDLRITCTTRTAARTGVEMEALVGASSAALTIYDMAKAGDRAMVIGPIQLETKSGGRSGAYRRGRD